jgi:hypothetical protein
MAQGATFAFTFTQAGEFLYHCSIHSSMTAKIIVTGRLGPKSGHLAGWVRWTRPSGTTPEGLVRFPPEGPSVTQSEEAARDLTVG